MTQKASQLRVAWVALAAIVLSAAAPGAARLHAAPSPSDKSRYTLLDPTPRDQMREFSTDRPDVTESAYTVDAGHFQLEMSLLEYAHDDSDGGTIDEFVVTPMNLKLGLLNNLDLQFVVEPYVYQLLRDGLTDHADGFGATQIRAKLNLFGNDEGEVALAVMPFVQFPTAADEIGGVNDLEGGIIFPLAISLPDDFSLGLMAEVDFLRDADDDGYGQSFLHTAALGHPLTDKLAAYLEYVGAANHDLGVGYVSLLGGGVTYELVEDVQLDAATYFGISDDADDFAARIGLSFRM